MEPSRSAAIAQGPVRISRFNKGERKERKESMRRHSLKHAVVELESLKMRDNKRSRSTLVFRNSGGTLLDVTGRSLSSVAKPVIQLKVVISREAESSARSSTYKRVGLHRVSVNSSLESIIIVRMRFYSGLRINLNVIRILSATHFEVIIFVQFYYPKIKNISTILRER